MASTHSIVVDNDLDAEEPYLDVLINVFVLTLAAIAGKVDCESGSKEEILARLAPFFDGSDLISGISRYGVLSIDDNGTFHVSRRKMCDFLVQKSRRR